jgi:hypothetical protein
VQSRATERRRLAERGFAMADRAPFSYGDLASAWPPSSDDAKPRLAAEPFLLTSGVVDNRSLLVAQEELSLRSGVIRRVLCSSIEVSDDTMGSFVRGCRGTCGCCQPETTSGKAAGRGQQSRLGSSSPPGFGKADAAETGEPPAPRIGNKEPKLDVRPAGGVRRCWPAKSLTP